MHRAISLVDIRSVPEAFEIFLSEDVDKFNALLYDIGFDTKEDIEMEVVLHRPMSCKDVVEGPRWVGRERRDEDWIKSKYCTWENKLEVIGTKDPKFQKELIKMGAFPKFTAMIIDHISEGQKKKSKQKVGA